MIERVHAPVSVKLIFNHKVRKSYPKEVQWEGKIYSIKKVGLHHTFREGRTLYHVFSAVSENIFFRLVLNTENLSWTVEEISDGEPD